MKKKIVLMSLGGSVGKSMLLTQCLHPHEPLMRSAGITSGASTKMQHKHKQILRRLKKGEI
jgi:hypothetical protein